MILKVYVLLEDFHSVILLEVDVMGTNYKKKQEITKINLIDFMIDLIHFLEYVMGVN